jgi:hypothetical protein
MTGRVWYDLNKNDKYDGRPVDVPIQNTTIFMVVPISRRRLSRAENEPIGTTRTNSEGRFVIAFEPQTPGTDMAIVKDLITRDPLLSFKATESGGAPNSLIPIARPAKVGPIPFIAR